MTAKLPKGPCPVIETAEGIIPAIAVKGHWLVCKVQKFKHDGKNRPYPERDGIGRIVYAVPGGGSYVQ
jgi:hypothetical protein